MVSGQYVMTTGILFVVRALFDFNDPITTGLMASGPAALFGSSPASSFKTLLVIFQNGHLWNLRSECSWDVSFLLHAKINKHAHWDLNESYQFIEF